jgi:hypothetical protein
MRGHVQAAHPDQVWALDFLVDQTSDGRPIKILTVTDEHTREALATTAARRIGADDTVSTLAQIVERRETTPAYIRCDNGPELTAEAFKDWCRFTGITTAYIEPGAPGRTPTSSPSTATSATNSSTWSHSTPCSKRNSSSTTGGSSTTTADPTNHSTTKPQQPTPTNGMLPTTTDPHNRRTINRGQVRPSTRLPTGFQPDQQPRG